MNAPESTPSAVSFGPPSRTLMGPGPSNVAPRVLEALARPTVGHLDPTFVGLMDDVKGLLQKTFRTDYPVTMPVSGPGTAGMQACVSNLVEPGDTVVVAVNGVFGGRLADMVRRVGGEAVVVEDAWGGPVDPSKIEAALDAHPNAKMVAFVHAETSTGAASDAAAIAAIARAHDCLTLVDTVTSLAGIPLEVGEWQLDAVYSGTQKCLSAPPGLSPVCFSPRAIDAIQARKTPVPSWFLDVSLVLGYWGDGAQRTYHHTAPINMIYALHESLIALHEEGLESAWARHRAQHERLRDGLDSLGLRLVVDAEHRLPQLNAVAIPDGVDDATVRRRLLDEHQLEIGAGLGPMAGKIWRIGLMGHTAREENVERAIRALGSVLQ